jgi:hypothetical protein
VNKSAAHVTPTIGVVAADDDYINRDAQVTQGAMEANRLLRLVIYLRLYYKETDVALRACFPTSMGAEENYLGVRGSRGQTASRLCNQGLVNYRHGWNRRRRHSPGGRRAG